VSEVLGADFTRNLTAKKNKAGSMSNVSGKLDGDEVVDWTSEVSENCSL
jgi:hypothetical protein